MRRYMSTTGASATGATLIAPAVTVTLSSCIISSMLSPLSPASPDAICFVTIYICCFASTISSPSSSSSDTSAHVDSRSIDPVELMLSRILSCACNPSSLVTASIWSKTYSLRSASPSSSPTGSSYWSCLTRLAASPVRPAPSAPPPSRIREKGPSDLPTW